MLTIKLIGVSYAIISLLYSKDSNITSTRVFDFVDNEFLSMVPSDAHSESQFCQSQQSLMAEENPHSVIKTNFQDRFSKNVWAGIIDDHLIVCNCLLGALLVPFLWVIIKSLTARLVLRWQLQVLCTWSFNTKKNKIIFFCRHWMFNLFTVRLD